MRHFISPWASFFFPVLKGKWALLGGENPFSSLHLADSQLHSGWKDLHQPLPKAVGLQLHCFHHTCCSRGCAIQSLRLEKTQNLRSPDPTHHTHWAQPSMPQLMDLNTPRDGDPEPPLPREQVWLLFVRRTWRDGLSPPQLLLAALLLQARVPPAFLARLNNLYIPTYYKCTLPSKCKRGTCTLQEKYQMLIFVIDFCQSSRGRTNEVVHKIRTLCSSFVKFDWKLFSWSVKCVQIGANLS